MSNKRAQITLFVIIAILLIAAIVLVGFLAYRPLGVPSEIAPVEGKVQECINQAALNGLETLGEQGGYIVLPEFEKGSSYAPFTSQFNFFGSTMPYWLYLSENGLYKTQVPTLLEMRDQLNEYVMQNAPGCDMSSFEAEGYSIKFEQPSKVVTDIRDDVAYVTMEWPVTIKYQDTSRRITAHKTTVESSLGRLYGIAKQVYDQEQSNLFLEAYTVDALALYVPGTGVEFTCAPKVWNKRNVVENLTSALRDNIATLKLAGDYYTLGSDERKYFVQKDGAKIKNAQVNFLYDPAFPTTVDVVPSSGDLMRADPIGTQEGIGIIGFCYVPYHFVYNVQYPVMVQVFDENYGLFQFPVIVSIEDNKPRGTGIEAEAVADFNPAICQYKNQDFTVNVVDVKGRAVDADISFKCSGTECPIGNAVGGSLEANFPQCVNGYMVAKKEGYADAKVEVSTNEGGSAQIIIKPKYTLDVVVLKDLVRLEEGESALITFSSSDLTQSIFYPQQIQIDLVEGSYKVTSYLFKDGKITLPAQSTEKCVNVPRSGIFGFMGFEREDCYTIDQPAQELTQLTIGGGTANVDLLDEDLADASFVGVEIGSQPIPKSLLDLQDVYNNIASSTINVRLK